MKHLQLLRETLNYGSLLCKLSFLSFFLMSFFPLRMYAKTYYKENTTNITMYVGEEIGLYYSQNAYMSRHYKREYTQWIYSDIYFNGTEDNYLNLTAIQECTDVEVSFKYSYSYTYYPPNSTTRRTDYYRSTITWKITVIPRPTPEQIVLNNTIIDIPINTQYKLSAAVLPEEAFQTITWSSEDSEIASVDENGLVTGVGLGDAIVQATSTIDNTVLATCQVHVGSTDVKTIDVSANQPLYIFDKTQLIPTISPSYAIYDLEWQSSNINVVTVDQEGNITGVGVGQADVIVKDKSTGVLASCHVIVDFKDGATFKGTLPNGTGFISTTFMLTDWENRYVSIGDGSYTAIPTSTTGSIIIPTTVNGPGMVTYIIKDIESNAFRSSNISSVEIPKEIASIGNNAFQSCSNLTSVTVENTNPLSINATCFSNASKATLNVPKDCYYTYAEADNWGSFKTIVEPPHENDDSFIASISLDEGTIDAAFLVIDDVNKYVSIGCGQAPAIDDLSYGAVVIPSSVKGYDGITYTVKQLNTAAFFGCFDLTSITIPSGITSIGRLAFYGCAAINSITLPSSVISLGENAFEYCSNLTSITIPSSVTTLGAGAFSNCRELTSVTVEWSKPISIDSECFTNAAHATLNVPKGSYEKYKAAENWKTFSNIIEPPHSYGDIFYAFITVNGSDIKARFKVSNSSYQYVSIGDGEESAIDNLTSGNVVIPTSVTGYDGQIYPVKQLSNAAFSDCSELTSIELPESITSIGHGAFAGCGKLTSVRVEWKMPLTIDNECFTDIANATLYVPYGAKERYKEANGWKLFTIIVEMEPKDGDIFTAQTEEGIEITFQVISATNNTCKVGADDGIVYSGVVKTSVAESLTIPQQVNGFNVISINDFAFNEITGLTSITLPCGLLTIGEYSFVGCSGLTSLTVPNSVTNIGDYAFEACNNLTSVTVGWDEPITISTNCFSNAANATLYVPIGRNKYYKAATGWKNFGVIANTTESMLFADDVIVCRGGRVVLPIYLNNVEDVQQLDFELSLPEGISVVTDDDGNAMASLSPRASATHRITGRQQSNGNFQFQVILKTISDNTIPGNNGRLANIPLKILLKSSPGDYDIKVTAGVLSVKDESQGIYLADTHSKLTVSKVLLGDTNDDEIINVVDISNIINYILGKNNPGFVWHAANASGDEQISVFDISTIIDIILGKTVFGEKQAKKLEDLEY